MMIINKRFATAALALTLAFHSAPVPTCPNAIATPQSVPVPVQSAVQC